MARRRTEDFAGGVALVLVGSGAGVYALTSLDFGTVRNMGPGMFPAALGGILVGLGVLIVLRAIGGPVTPPSVTMPVPSLDFRALSGVLGAILVFAVMIEPFGMIPTILATTLVASQADRRLSLRTALALAVGLSAATTLVFQVGLGLQVAAFAWPW